MAPHRILAIPEILHEVFGNFSVCPQLSLPSHGTELGSFKFPNDLGDRENFKTAKAKRRTLACAARTCKAFSEPASGVLWEVIDDFTPIESILGNARIYEGDEKAHVLERIEQIARRIRALACWTPTTHMPGDNETLAAFCSRFDGGRPMFPNLRVLCVFWGVTGGDAWLSFLKAVCASPSLALFSVSTEHDLAILKILAAAAVAPQQIIHLKAPTLWRVDEEGHQTLAKFSNLHTAHFMAIDATLFRRLAALPNLRVLHGCFAISGLVMDMRGAFPALQEISTQDMDQEARRHFLAVLPYISSRSLTHLSLRTSVPRTEDMVQYLNDLSTSPATAQLRQLTLCVDIEFNEIDNEGEVPDGVSLASDVLAPLKPLSALTDIAFVVCFQTPMVATFTVRDEDLDAVASAWPGLVSAKFGFTIQWDNYNDDGPWGITRPSLSAVVALAERCRSLERLDVEFGSVGERELALLEAHADACVAPQTALRRIVFDPDSDFCDTLCVEDPQRLAEVLRRLFPNLRSGLEVLPPEGGPDEEEQEVKYRGWGESAMDTDAFCLLEALDDKDHVEDLELLSHY